MSLLGEERKLVNSGVFFVLFFCIKLVIRVLWF